MKSNTILYGLILGAAFTTELGAQLTPEEIPLEFHHIPALDIPDWTPPQEISEKLPYYLSGFDNEGRPIWVVEAGKWDFRTLVERGTKWEALVDKYIEKYLWRLYNSTGMKATVESPVKDVVLIIDCEGVRYRQFSSPAALDYYLKQMRVIAKAMPLVHDVFVLNANFVTRSVLELLRPILGREFYRVEVFGTNPNRYKPALIKILPQDQIPEKYGGKKGFKPVKVSVKFNGSKAWIY